jgi:drug/metabolite transporter (DMT)-like permease
MHTKPYFCDLLMLSVVGIWGFNFAIVKYAFADFQPLAFNALRFTVASVAMACLAKALGYPLRIEKTDWIPVLSLALLSNVAYQFLFVIGLARTKAGNAGLLMALTPIFAYLIGVFGKRESFSRQVLLGIALSLVGVAAIVYAGKSEIAFGNTWKGDLMLTGAAFCWGWYSGAATRLLAKYGAIRLTVFTMIFGTSIMIPLSLPWILRQNWGAISMGSWASFSYSALLTIVYCYFVWAYALNRIGIARTAIFSNLTPIVALFGGWLLLKEIPNIGQIVGVFCVLSGILIVRSHKHELD